MDTSFIAFCCLLLFLPGLTVSQCTPSADTSDATCQRYYACSSSGSTFQTSCPAGQVWYPGYNKCVLSDSYDCNCVAPCQRPVCRWPNRDIADTTNCNRFVFCDGYYPLRRNCPSGQLFNPKTESCESRSTTTYQCPSDPFPCPATNGYYGDTRDPLCRNYVYCNNGSPTKLSCDPTYVYYPKMGRCVLDYSYDCRDPNPFQCPGNDRDYADPYNSNRYYYCMGNIPLHRNCSAGQTFNSDPSVNRCYP